MNEKSQPSAIQKLLLEQLRDPIRLRFVLCGALLAAWYLGHHSPTVDHIQLTTTRIDQEKKRIAMAEDVERLRGVLAPFRDRIPAESTPNEMMQYVISHVRETGLDLIDLSPAQNVTLGTLRATTLQIKLEGSYAGLDNFLTWVENEKRLLRVDSLRVQPKNGPKYRLNIQLNLTGLVEAPRKPNPPQTAPGKSTAKS
jgi:hypothetical protein